MAGPGGGPSRRSHTKSRKGCKTCKRRHIRCDENFPQCRNCTKHQVRCDYMDSPTASGEESQGLPQEADLLWTPEIERAVEIWRQTNEFPFPELHIFPQPQWHLLTKVDLRLIYHLASITSQMQQMRTSSLTLWTEQVPKFLSTAAQHPFVMHAALAFSANHLAWVSQSSETRNLAFNYSAAAMKGLHEAIGSFSKANSDAVLAASLLLSWQSTEWRGWVSLMTGINTIMNAMQSWRNESLFAHYILEQAYVPVHALTHPINLQVGAERHRDHANTLQHVQNCLLQLQPYLASYDQEGKWIEQLRGYIERVRSSNPAQTAEEQFSQLYALRKWLFWVPISLLSSRKGDVYVLLVLAHFYATTLALEPIFSDIGAGFCANIAAPPLDEIIRIINTLQSTQGYNQSMQAASIMMEFPRETANTFRSRKEWRRQRDEMHSMAQSPYGLDTLTLDLSNQIAEFGYGQSLSPAFAPSPLHMSPANAVPSSTPRSPYLEVPHSGMDSHGYVSSNSVYSTPMTTPLQSPAAHQTVFAQEESMYGYAQPMGYPGGFVAPTTIWT